MYYGNEENTRQHLCHDGYPRGYKYQKVYSRLQTKPYQTAQAFEKGRQICFGPDFQYIAKFLSEGYNKKELSKELKTSSQILTHTKDTLHTLASITGDQRYLTAQESYKEGLAVCEVAETLFQMGVEESKKSSNSKSRFSPSAKYDCRKNAEIERLRAENERLKQTQ